MVEYRRTKLFPSDDDALHSDIEPNADIAACDFTGLN